jgi:hypothetical protein
VERLGISSIFEDMRTHSSSQMLAKLDAHECGGRISRYLGVVPPLEIAHHRCVLLGNIFIELERVVVDNGRHTPADLSSLTRHGGSDGFDVFGAADAQTFEI